MLKRIFSVLFESFFLLALVLSVIHYIEIQTSFIFPSPAGQYLAGTSYFHWIDRGRLESHAVVGGHPYRELMGQLWYPADSKTEKKLLPYDARSWKDAINHSGIPGFMLTGLDSIVTHASLNALPIQQKSKFPVVIMDHGLGSVGLTSHIALCESLASHGYFVIGVNHSYCASQVTFPDGRVVTNHAMPDLSKLERSERLRLYDLEQRVWIEDIQFVLDVLEDMNADDERFTGKLDLEHIGMVGHSFGGSTASQLCRIDARIKAGINMDGALRGDSPIEGFDKPFMFLMASPRENDAGAQNRELFNNLMRDSYFVAVEGTHHGSFSDEVLLAKRAILYGLMDKVASGLDLLDGYKVHEITQALVVDFFDKYLKKKPSKLLDVQEKKYKEVAIELK